jgi:hypothetical protein
MRQHSGSLTWTAFPCIPFAVYKIFCFFSWEWNTILLWLSLDSRLSNHLSCYFSRASGNFQENEESELIVKINEKFAFRMPKDLASFYFSLKYIKSYMIFSLYLIENIII